MPKRLIRPVVWVQQHVSRYPGRLVFTAIAILFLSLGLLIYAIRDSWDQARQGRIDNCIAVNELRTNIYIFLADNRVPPEERRAFLPTTKCEDTP